MSIEIETERLLLRRPCAGDVDSFAEYLADPEVMRFLGGATVPREDAPAVIDRWLEVWETDGFGKLTVLRRADGALLGRVGINVFDTRDWTHSTRAAAGDHGQPELGWTFLRAYWGNGYATEAARAAREWARGALDIDRLISLISGGNLRSRAVAERLGAAPSGMVSLAVGGLHDVWVHP